MTRRNWSSYGTVGSVRDTRIYNDTRAQSTFSPRASLQSDSKTRVNLLHQAILRTHYMDYRQIRTAISPDTAPHLCRAIWVIIPALKIRQVTPHLNHE